MFGFGRREKFKRHVAKHMTTASNNVCDLLANQIAVVVEHRVCTLDELWREAYARQYLFGAFEALTYEFPQHIRKKMEHPIMELSFKNFVTRVFALSELEASAALTELFLFRQANPAAPALADGRADGLVMMEGTPANRLVGQLYDIFVEGQ